MLRLICYGGCVVDLNVVAVAQLLCCCCVVVVLLFLLLFVFLCLM